MSNIPMGLIGGHRGLDVRRVKTAPANVAEGWPEMLIEKAPQHIDGNQGDLVGVDLYEMNVTAIHNEAFALCEMEGSGFTPRLIDVEGDVLYQEDVGVQDGPLDAEVWRQNCVRMLATIRSRGLRHGDLRGTNIITRGNDPYAIDWQESHRIGDVAPQKSPYSDSSLLMQHIEGTYGPDGQLDTPRVARRWGAILGALGATTNLELPLKGKSFLDLGCFQGDFCALAASEGMDALGIDQGGFRTGENSIEIARQLWDSFPFGDLRFAQRNFAAASDPKRRPITTLPSYAADVVMMFSTWSYVVQHFGRDHAQEILRKVIAEAGTFFFENQLAGDGPGPKFLQEDKDIRAMMFRLGATTVNVIGTFPVTGRPASRTVWMVQR